MCLNSFIAAAQIDNSKASEGSFYSQFGVGLPVEYGSSSAEGMGLWGVSDNETLVPSLANPAHWGSTVYGLGTGGIGINNYHSKDNSGTATNSLISINHFQLQLPLYKGKLGISASFSPYSREAYEVFNGDQQVLSRGNAIDTLSYQTVRVGGGGVSRYELGIGWKINKNVSLGYAASLYHASIDHDFTTVFDTTGFGPRAYSNINTTLQTSGSGFGNRFGAYFTLPSVAGKKDQLHFGLVLRLPVKLKGERVEEATYVSGDPNDVNSGIEQKLASGTIHLPLGLTAGLTYEPSPRVAVSVEGRYEKWSNFENNLDPSAPTVSFTDRTKVGAGLKFYPYLSGSDKFLSHFKYRLGASYDTGHLKIRGQNIETLMLSAGLGIITSSRVNGFRSSVDISFQYGIRGTKSQNLVKDNFWGVKLSVNLAELFFFRPKLK